MNFKLFHEAIFDMATVWCETDSKEEYENVNTRFVNL